MSDTAKKRNFTSNLFVFVPEEYRSRFAEEQLDTNIERMHGLAIYIVVVQIILQVVNGLLPQHSIVALAGSMANFNSLPYYIILSLASLLFGIIYWILFAFARKGKIKSRRGKMFLVQSLLYIYALIQLAFSTVNVLTQQGVNSYIMLVLMIGMIPILHPKQSIATILLAFLYTIGSVFFTQDIKDISSLSSWDKLIFTDMRANLLIITGITVFISVFIYNLYVSNFVKKIELENQNANLETTVLARTKELEEKTIVAEAASKAKSKFLASMSHEIRTPLNAIIGMAQIAKKTGNKEKSDASIDKILGASDHLLGILNDILDMSNIESGQLNVESERFVLRRAMDEVVNIISVRCAKKGLIFEHNINFLPEDAIIGDRLRLKQILLNLLGNALKFTPEDGKVDFTVTIQEETDASIEATFSVKDNGIGITDEQKSRLFIAFDQGTADGMKHSGTGLGLAISQQLIAMMGSTIAFDSIPGKGSTFTFTLSLQKATNIVNENEFDVPDLTGKRILIVEDIEINRMVLAELLSETHSLIDEAVDGVEAVEKFKVSPENYYHFIFMDLLMPNMNGNDAARTLRTLPREDAKSIPIVALSANAYQEDIDQALLAGMNGHLAKPVDIADIMQTLTKMLA
ncbi:ATP-binding protein [Lachnospiraceae bacterium ZAX-1]